MYKNYIFNIFFLFVISVPGIIYSASLKVSNRTDKILRVDRLSNKKPFNIEESKIIQPHSTVKLDSGAFDIKLLIFSEFIGKAFGITRFC